MPNQVHPNRKRAVFIVNKEDYATLERYAENMGYTTSILLREATFRLAKEIRDKKKIYLLQTPKAGEGESKRKK